MKAVRSSSGLHADGRRAWHRRPLTRSLLAFVLVLFTLSGCDSVGSEPAARAEATRELIVFAAASLRECFGRMAAEFQQSHAGVTVVLNFAGTQELRTQLEQGAVVDVFASADLRHMAALRGAGRVAPPSIFATNEPIVVVAKESSTSIRALAELPNAARIVIGAAEVPIGKYTLQILDKASNTLGADFRARVEARVVSRELNVRQVLAKVKLGEADAGVVYRSELAGSESQVGVVAIPPEFNVVAEYPIAVVQGAPHQELAREWVAFVESSRGRAILRQAGFREPPMAGVVSR